MFLSCCFGFSTKVYPTQGSVHSLVDVVQLRTNSTDYTGIGLHPHDMISASDMPEDFSILSSHSDTYAGNSKRYANFTPLFEPGTEILIPVILIKIIVNLNILHIKLCVFLCVFKGPIKFLP